MNYFTDTKFEDKTAYSDYIAYCNSIWDKLPNELKSIQKGMVSNDMLNGLPMIEFHDGKIVAFKKDAKSIYIQLHTNNNGYLRKVWLEYCFAEVLILPQSDVLGECIDDIMCHEITLFKDDEYIHTLLFASNEELSIRFKKLSLKFEDF